MEVGRSSAFEIFVGESKEQIYSKLEKGSFPDSKAIVELVKAKAA